MTTERLFRVLAKIHPLTEAFKDALKNELQFVAYPKGHYLIQARTVARHAYFLQTGFSVSYLYHEGDRVVTGFWQPGDIILSPKSFFRQTPTDEIIELTTNSELLAITYESALKLFERFPEANIIARAITADYHAKSDERVVDFHTLSAWDRYTKLIRDYPSIELNLTQDFIASYLNVTPQTLSRLKSRHN